MNKKKKTGKINYKTTIEGTNEIIVFNGELGSGYRGEGPNGLIYVLEKLGLSKEQAEGYVLNEMNKTFTVNF